MVRKVQNWLAKMVVFLQPYKLMEYTRVDPCRDGRQKYKMGELFALNLDSFTLKKTAYVFYTRFTAVPLYI